MPTSRPILVTGAAGFLGLNVVEALLQRGDGVVAVDRRALPDIALGAVAPHARRLHVVQADVTDAGAMASVIGRLRPRGIVHTAAITSGPAMERAHAALAADVNVRGTLNVLEAAASAGVERVVHFSSGAVYGDNGFGEAPLDEAATVPAPSVVYAITKLAGERLALRYRAIAGLNLVVARVGTAFGPWEGDTGVRETLSPHFQATRLARAGGTALLARPGLRDWIYSRDIAGAALALLDRASPTPEVANIGTGQLWSVAQWCTLLQARHPSFWHGPAATPAAATVNLWADRDRAPLAVERLQREVGYRPRFDLEQAFADYADWLDRTGWMLQR
ncbi:MAG: NAD(P)-dependent oxidoreductase [Alphaproteobacteria bacterium]|nr:NAD(P)-dependent oxidoreductase [Alphaproteobacteria bacterium]